MNLDWTAIAVAGLGSVMTIVGWALNRSFGRIDSHMTEVSRFMGESAKNEAVMANEIKNHGHRITNVEQRVNVSHRVDELHGLVTEIQQRGCGAAA